MDFSLSNQHMYSLKIYRPNSFGLNCTFSHQRNTCFAELIQIFTLIQKAYVGNGRIEGQNPGSAWSVGWRCPKRKNVHRLLENEIPTLFYIYKQQNCPEQSST